MTNRPRLALVSRVLPFPGHAGQQQRVRNKLIALRERFHITFITVAPQQNRELIREALLEHCDEALVLSSRYARSLPHKLWHQVLATAYSLKTGLKRSNYFIGNLEFAPRRIDLLLNHHNFDLALFEYWHAVDATSAFRDRHIPTVLDMHDILWQSYSRQLSARTLPSWWRQRQVSRYRLQEEAAWRRFDALITINAAEHDYVRQRLPDPTPLFYAPMGTDLSRWPYGWQRANPPRIAYYGGLGSPHNQRDALRCFEQIMPLVWQQCPDAELWLVGSNPPDRLRTIPQRDPRVRVTGFVREVQELLSSMSAVLCPWTGRYGFRSRLVEVMALGVPVVTTPDAVYGMGLEHEQGVLLAPDDRRLALQTLRLLNDSHFAGHQSQCARHQVEERYSFDNTYGRLTSELSCWLQEMQRAPA